jgi:hypothetical protein
MGVGERDLKLTIQVLSDDSHVSDHSASVGLGSGGEPHFGRREDIPSQQVATDAALLGQKTTELTQAWAYGVGSKGVEKGRRPPTLQAGHP